MLNITINTQPDEETCGPTSLHAVYRYYQDKVTLSKVIQGVERVKNGGTLAALLGKHALDRDYKATIYAYNLDVFDPTWFQIPKLTSEQIVEKLKTQYRYKKSKRLWETSQAYIDFLNKGGVILFRELTVNLLKAYFEQKIPVLTGLSATYLYQSKREFETRRGKLVHDDIRGEPSGHFVILCGYDENKRHIVVADPHRRNPISSDNYYKVNISRLLNAIMLGVLTRDANLLIIEPKETFEQKKIIALKKQGIP
ncbi:MAG: peptidase-C39 like family protein [Gammaproteobacteria bacterium RIFCSPHIGHO2_12_FULL_35_23]|nr:MAG: peptidase-C39 like family protein [Gammaproteobacteria bacterium RIFCSPHIGHO2_12_FULL_35_23]